MMKLVSTTNAPAALGPYSQAQVVGSMVYTSGQLGIDPATGALLEGVEAQAHQAFKNLAAVLKAAGSDMSKVVKTTVFIKNMDDFGAVNAVYAQYFTEPFPVRSCVEVARLPKDGLVECEVIAEL
ncbi:MAG: RidA family protein [Oscillospiraceae bacterium]|nr:RidA family protein [Oscillospiraceae bacterium]